MKVTPDNPLKQYHKPVIMAKKPLTNNWKAHHQHLEKQSSTNEKSKATACKEKICELNGWSNTTFYRKMESSTTMSISEKLTVASVYDMPAYFLFPDMEIVH